MSSYSELEQEFERKVAELQAKCSHGAVSEWMDEFYDFRSTEHKVKNCLICDKQIIRKLII